MIVVFTNRSTWVFSVNGDFVRKTANDVAIVAWTTFVSNAGFDYIVYGDPRGDVGWFEALYPERKTSLFRFPDLAVLHYKRSEQSIVALSTQGRVKICRLSREIPV
jgi:hypothetical protein